ncbi:hypothetical protein CQA66_08450 [Helicobacter aurati]|uniref:Uncharacterized protein n=1 Tax=Helicobacter aurati TaxID=137778 RepID=A0A3D8IYS9_9HELI|nr:hypothetical protein [Helicobacter aurati]RDU70429.1 hypothetical protein CQA66_08450 [Helicobacter aurati]
MTSFELDSKNNLVYGYSFFEVDNKKRILQDIKTKIGMIVGENPFDSEEGFDFISYIQNNTYNIQSRMKEECKKIEDVQDILINTDNDGNIVNFQILTQAGETLNV